MKTNLLWCVIKNGKERDDNIDDDSEEDEDNEDVEDHEELMGRVAFDVQ